MSFWTKSFSTSKNMFSKIPSKVFVIIFTFLAIATSVFYFSQPEKFGAGYTPVTDYQARTTSFVNASATTIPVNTTQDPAGNEIQLSSISPSSTPFVFFMVEPQTSRQEIIGCTGKSTNNWTSCLRGLPFQGGSLSASSTLAFPHNAGSRIIMSNVGQFYGNYVSLAGNETLYGTKTFDTFPGVTSTTAVPGSANELATKYYVDLVGAGGLTAANVSTTLGLQVFSTGVPNCDTAAACAGINASTTASNNGGFLKFAPITGKIYWDIVSFLAGSWSWAGTNIFANARITSLDATTTAQTLHISGTPVATTDAVNKTYVDALLHAVDFGDGSDGASSTASGTFSLNRDYYFTTFTVTTSTVLNTNGYRIFAQTLLRNQGTIQSNGPAGGAASLTVAGVSSTATLAGSLPAGTIGSQGGAIAGSGGTSAAGVAGTNVTRSQANPYGGVGGTGGTSQTGSPGAGGAASTDTTSSTRKVFNLTDAMNWYEATGTAIAQFSIAGGASGGGGGGPNQNSSAGAGGGGGGSGGPMVIAAQAIVNSGTISSNGGVGGVGGNAQNSNNGGGGGGGGGSGGVLVLIYRSLTDTGSIVASGGAGGVGGAGIGTGTAGATGTTGPAGKVVRITTP